VEENNVLMSNAVPDQAQKPTTGYAPVNGLEMYYEIHGSGSGEPLVLLHGSFMTISNNWTGWIGELSKGCKVIAVEMQGHGRTADINRDFSYENLADDIAAMLDYLEIKQADLLGYSMGGGVAMQVAIRHPEKVGKVVCISAFFRRDGMVKEALDAFPRLTADTFQGSPIEAEYKKLSPTPNEFPNFVKRVVAIQLKPYDFGAAPRGAARQANNANVQSTRQRCEYMSMGWGEFTVMPVTSQYDESTSARNDRFSHWCRAQALACAVISTRGLKPSLYMEPTKGTSADVLEPDVRRLATIPPRGSATERDRSRPAGDGTASTSAACLAAVRRVVSGAGAGTMVAGGVRRASQSDVARDAPSSA
jgi:pimeloyl-ACP methyl ester carboxylesterase